MELLERLEKIQRKTDSIDFAGLFTDLNGINRDIEGIVNRPPGITADEAREMIQEVHDNIDEIKHNPIMSANKPSLSKEHFDYTIRPLLDVVQNVHHSIQESNHLPELEPQPISGLSRQIESYHKNDLKNYENLEAKLDGIVSNGGNFGNQVRKLRGEFKKSLEAARKEHEAHQSGLENKIDGLTNVGRGALITSGITLTGLMLWKVARWMTGKKVGRVDKDSSQDSGTRVHARSWNGGKEVLRANSG